MINEDQRAGLIKYRLDKAAAALSTAGLMLDGGALDGAINRAYYAMFHAINALAAFKSYSGKTHNGLIR